MHLKIDDDYFLLGTLNDYLGRQVSLESEYLIDYYFLNEKPLMDYLKKTYKNQYSDFRVNNCIKKNNRYC